jgi:UDP-N-acetylmuramoyl-L-alanyl-D-glutamate--2,6-diaminopimelate ligase
MARSRTLSVLLNSAGIDGTSLSGADLAISGIGLDSRSIQPGDLFCAIRGLGVDGESFIPQALENGARAILAHSSRPAGLDDGISWIRAKNTRRATALLSREFWDRPDEALSLVGITGTNGKTTVAYLLEAIATAAGLRTGRIGTISHALENVEQPAARTTPEAPDFYRLLAQMRNASINLVASEISSHALALHRVDGVRFTAAAFLNLGSDHLDFHSDLAAYFEAKAILIETLPADRTAVLPADTDEGKALAERCRARIITFGRSEGATVRLHNEHHGLEGSTAVLDIPTGTLPVRTHLLGGFNLLNVAAAAACALAVDMPPEAISSGVPALRRVPGRMEPIQQGQPFTVLVDFAHTAAALEQLLDSLRELTQGRLHVLFGCGGNRDAGKRSEMGRVASSGADRIYLTSDNPRDEDPGQIIEQVLAGVAARNGGIKRCTVVDDRRQAIHSALQNARTGDLVVLAGKGHETTQVQAGCAQPFDDREVAREILARLGWCGGVHAKT